VRILFICKKRGPYSHGTFGLWNSARFVADSLSATTDVVCVVDANGIDREVTLFNPDVVVLEAIWVTPMKLRELAARHSKVQWIVRIHSKATFLAQEGVAFEWINDYVEIRNVRVSTNNREFNDDLVKIGYPVVYLPNVYQLVPQSAPTSSRDPSTIHIGCFGAIRLLKNHLGQAVAAIRFADRIAKKLHFHINNDCTGSIDNVLKNLRALFRGTRHQLVEHSWLPHDEFCEVVAGMDLGMQVSLSESFNIVTADFVRAGVPVVASKEVKHVHWLFKCHNVTGEIVRTLHLAWYFGGTRLNQKLLTRHNIDAVRVWESYINDR